jgi:nitrogen fixation NifU-like protein
MTDVKEKNMNEEDIEFFPRAITELAKNPGHLGRMNDPTASALIQGPCGDEMEFYLVIRNRIIEEIKFYTKGCIATRMCGETTAQLAEGKSIDEALGICPKHVMELLGSGLPEDHSHCSILAVSTLYRAIADYLLKA